MRSMLQVMAFAGMAVAGFFFLLYFLGGISLALFSGIMIGIVMLQIFIGTFYFFSFKNKKQHPVHILQNEILQHPVRRKHAKPKKKKK